MRGRENKEQCGSVWESLLIVRLNKVFVMKEKSKLVVYSVAVLALAGLSCLVLAQATSKDSAEGVRDAEPAKANLDDLERRVADTVREYGVVESAATIDLRSQVKQPTTILEVVPEGAAVQKGDLLVKLEDSALRDQLAQQRVAIETARAQSLQAKATLDELKQSAVAQLAAAEARVQVAELARAKLLDKGGELDFETQSLQNEIRVAKQQQSLAQQRLKRLEQGSLATPDALEETRLVLVEAETTIDTAEAKLQLIERHIRPYETAALNLAGAEAKAELAQIQQVHQREINQAKTELGAREAALNVALQQLKDIEQQIASCAIHAPQGGTVVYNNVFSSRGGASFQVEPGAQVRERQSIVRLADLSRLQVNVKVNETRIARVRPGQAVMIHCDAFPDRTFRGKVQTVSRFPEPSTWLNDNVKNYSVIVSIDDPSPNLRLGLTAMAEIDVSE